MTKTKKSEFRPDDFVVYPAHGVGKIVSVEARHASAIHDLLAPRGNTFAPDIFDAGFTPQQVLAAAGAFVRDTINVINA